MPKTHFSNRVLDLETLDVDLPLRQEFGRDLLRLLLRLRLRLRREDFCLAYFKASARFFSYSCIFCCFNISCCLSRSCWSFHCSLRLCLSSSVLERRKELLLCSSLWADFDSSSRRRFVERVGFIDENEMQSSTYYWNIFMYVFIKLRFHYKSFRDLSKRSF